MAKSFLTDINLNGNVLQRAKIDTWGSAPGNSVYHPNATAVAANYALPGQLSYYSGNLYVFVGAGNGSGTWTLSGGSITLGSTTISSGGTAGVSGTPLTSVYLSSPNLAGTVATALTASRVVVTDASSNLSVSNDITSFVAAGSTAAAGKLQLTDSTSSTSTTTAATPNSVKTAYDLANAALPKSGGTMTGKITLGGGGSSTAVLNIPAQAPVTSGFVTGDVWYEGTLALKFRDSTGTKTLAFTDSNISGTSSGVSGTQTANYVYAAPNGSNGTATFRALVAADIPTLGNITNAGAIGSTSGYVVSTTTSGVLTASAALPSGTTATTQTASDNSTKVATTAYVDSAVSTLSSGVNAHDAVKYATTTTLALTFTASSGTVGTAYNNNTTGVGATLTVSITGGTSPLWTAIQIDGQALTVGDRVLIKNESTGAWNGIYTVTTVGTTANNTAFVFTRATDSDATPELGQGDLTYVLTGSSNGGNSFVQTSVVTTVGTSSITWSQFSGPGTYTFSSPISMSSNTVSLSSGYGDTQNPYISKTANYVLAAPNGSAGTPSFRALVAADVPTLNQNTTGSAATLTTSRSLWGQTFNGSADVTGNLTSVGNITGSAGNSMTITSATSGNGSLTLLSAGTGAITIGSTTSGSSGTGGLNIYTPDSSAASASNITILSGTSTFTNGNGGTVRVDTGAKNGTGTSTLQLGNTNATALTIGNSSSTSTIYGDITFNKSALQNGFVKSSAAGVISAASIAFSDLPTSSLTLVTTTGIARKTSGTITGNGSTTAFTVNHAYGQWVHAQLFDNSGNLVEVDINNASTSNGTTSFTFATAPTNGTVYNYVIIG